MAKSKLRQLMLPVFFMVFALSAFTSASALELAGGWQSIAISEDMVGKSLSQIKGDCVVVVAWGAFSTKRPTSPTEGNWVRLHWQDDSRTITAEMAGFGLWIYTPENVKCDLQAKGYAGNLGKASRLAAGSNFISVSKGMLQKSFSDISNTCSISKVRLYSPEACKLAREKAETIYATGEEICEGDYAIVKPEDKLSDSHLGKGVWVKAASDCTLDDGTPSEVLCNEAECAAKSGCDGTDYNGYGCVNKECSLKESRACTEEEKAKREGVNLVPELVVTPSENLKSGSSVEVALYVKNTGTKSTHAAGIRGKCAGTSDNNCRMSFFNIVNFYKDKEYGTAVLPFLSADVSLLFPEKEIKPGGEGSLEVIKRSVKIPDDFSGDLIIVAVVDSQYSYVETEGGEDDNKQLKTLAVKATFPNLAPTEAEASPPIEALPQAISHVKVAVKNSGDRAATGEMYVDGGTVFNPVLVVDASVLKGNVEVCKGQIREQAGEGAIKPNEVRRMAIPVSSTSGGQCVLNDKSSNYWTVVDVDTLQVGTAKGLVAESNENDNTQTFQLKGLQQCSPFGAREAGTYCSIAIGTWLSQKDAGRQCSHSFECQTDLCIKNKCIDAETKAKILALIT